MNCGNPLGVSCFLLAGIPPSVINTAASKLLELEHQERLPANSIVTIATTENENDSTNASASPQPFQSELFTSQEPKAITTLKNTDPDDLNPRQALDLVYKLIKQLD